MRLRLSGLVRRTAIAKQLDEAIIFFEYLCNVLVGLLAARQQVAVYVDARSLRGATKLFPLGH